MYGRALTAAVLGSFVLQACVAVLGMERAELDQDAGAGTGGAGVGASGGSGGSTTSKPRGCVQPPTTSCLGCLQDSCSADYDACIADATCRRELDAYAKCLGDRCDQAAETCAFDAGLTDNLSCLSGCAEGSDGAPAPCDKTNLAEPCQLYCACMQQFCASELVNVTSPCLATCRTWPAEVTRCRRNHCEWGLGDSLPCQHASGFIPSACPSFAERPEGDRTGPCTSGNESNYACDVNANCCSGTCLSGVCK